MSDPRGPISPDVRQAMDEYGLSPEEAVISLERRKVYGDPTVNHDGIAAAWAGILQPWAHRIAANIPVPAHVVAMLMVALKTNRTRIRYHKDNYDDIRVYLAFAQAWQRKFESDSQGSSVPYDHAFVIPAKPHPDAVIHIEWRVPAKDSK